MLPGVPELYQAFTRRGVHSVILSNNARVTSDGITQWMREKCGVSDFSNEQAMTSAEAAAQYFHERIANTFRPFLIGESGLWEAFKRLDVPTCNHHWDGQQWKDDPPTHVVKGFKSDGISHKDEEAPGCNALYEHGAALIMANTDSTYRNAQGTRCPANGIQSRNFIDAAGGKYTDLGKPNIGMAEEALQRMGAEKKSARVVVIGDNLETDMVLAGNLRSENWDAEGWLVLTGDTKSEQVSGSASKGMRIFSGLHDIVTHLLKS